MVYFFHPGRKFFFASPINNMHLCTQTQRCSRRIHGHIPAAYYRDFFSSHNGCRGFLIKCFHQVASGQIFIGRKYPVGLFTRYSHEFGQSCPRTDKYRIETFFFHKFINRYRFSHYHIGFYFYPKGFHIFYFLSDYIFLGQTEFRDTVYKHAARLMEGFEDSHFIPHLCQIPCTCKPCRAGTDDSHFFAVLLLWANRFYSLFPGPVCHETFQFADGNRLAFDPADTFPFTLALLRAYPAANRRKGTGFTNYLISGLHIPFLYFLNKTRNINRYRTTLDTLGIFTVDTSVCFFHRFFFIISKAHLFEICGAYLCILFTYRHLL